MLINITVCKFHCNISHQLGTGTKSYLILLVMDSTSSQIWAIFLPNRNFYELISWPPGSPKVRSQNEGYQQYLFKITGKLDFLSKIY